MKEIKNLINMGFERIEPKRKLGKGNDILGSLIGETLMKNGHSDPLLTAIKRLSSNEIFELIKNKIITPETKWWDFVEQHHLEYGWSERPLKSLPLLWILRRNPNVLSKAIGHYGHSLFMEHFSDLDNLYRIESAKEFKHIVQIVFEESENLTILANYFYRAAAGEVKTKYSDIIQALNEKQGEELLCIHPTNVKYLKLITEYGGHRIRLSSAVFIKAAEAWSCTKECNVKKIAALMYISNNCNIQLNEVPKPRGLPARGMKEFLSTFKKNEAPERRI